MATIVEAIYENGVLKPLTPVGLRERHRYRISLEEAEKTENKDQTWLTAPLPELGNIIFHEDPSLPLDSADWPEKADETDS